MNKYKNFSKVKEKRCGYSILTCKNKRRYVTYEFAERMAARQSADFGYPMYVYSCAMCRGYHTTKQPSLIDQITNDKRNDSID